MLIQAVAHDMLRIHVVIKTLTIKTEVTASISTRNSEFACFMLICFVFFGVLVECKFETSNINQDKPDACFNCRSFGQHFNILTILLNVCCFYEQLCLIKLPQPSLYTQTGATFLLRVPRHVNPSTSKSLYNALLPMMHQSSSIH